jgi:uncharacterized protein involved in exopolysaccharide biosynthesis
VELRHYLSIAARYRWYLICIPIIAALVALGATYVVSPRYVGTAVVQLIPEEVEPRAVSLRNQEGASSVAIGLRDPTELLSQGVIESAGSAEVAHFVTDKVKLGNQPAPTGWSALKAQVRQLIDDAWALARFGYIAHKPSDQALVDRVGDSISAELIRGSYYMEISATWRDPETASLLANAAVEGVIAHAREIAHASAAEQRQFLEAQRLDARHDVETARAAMLQYSGSSSVVAGASLRAALNDLEAARAAQRQNELDLAEANKRLATARQQLQNINPEVVITSSAEGSAQSSASTVARSVLPNLAYQTLQDRVAALGQDVAGLQTRRDQAGNEVTAQIDLSLADARQRLATAQSQLQQDGLSDLVYDQLKAQALSLEQEVAALEGQRESALASQQAQNESALAEAQRRLSEAQQQLSDTSPTVESTQTTSGGGASQSGQQTTTSPNPVYQSIQRDTLSLEQAVNALEAQKTQLGTNVSEREQRLRALTSSDGQLAALNQELALATDTYARRTQDWYNAVLEESRPVAPIRLIDPAATPVYPSYPIKIFWALIGAAAGMALALVLVFVRYNTDVSLRTADEAEDALTMPLLAVVPGTRSGRRGGS